MDRTSYKAGVRDCITLLYKIADEAWGEAKKWEDRPTIANFHETECEYYTEAATRLRQLLEDEEEDASWTSTGTRRNSDA